MVVSSSDFLKAVDTIQSLNPEYKLGHYGDDGFCDCIGLIIGAIRRCGGKWAGIHGSNYAARFEIFGGVEPIKNTSQLVPGMAVFKAKDDITNLPKRYLSGGNYYTGDLRDYYHVGTVYSVNPLIIKHCTTGSEIKNGKRVDILEDKRLGKWSYCGKLTLVDYDGKSYMQGDEHMEQGYIVSAEGGVNFRVNHDKGSTKICTIPEGDVVYGTAYNSAWLKVTYNGKTGYVMSEFLEEWEDVTDQDDPVPVQGDSIEERIAAIESRLSALEKTVGSSIGLG